MANHEYNQDMFTALQVRAVMEHKWFMGERLHHDIKDNDAWIEWVNIHYAERFRDAYESRLCEVLEACHFRCPEGCKGVQKCDMDENTLHKLIIL